MLHIATQVPEQCEYPVTSDTQQHVSIFLAQLYEDMVRNLLYKKVTNRLINQIFDQRRATYKERVDQVFGGLMSDIEKPQNKIKLAALLITLLHGPVDVGINLVTSEQVTAIMLKMASSDDSLQQSIAAELIVCSVSKYERATNMIKHGLVSCMD